MNPVMFRGLARSPALLPTKRGTVVIVLGIVLAVIFGWLVPVVVLFYLGVILIILGVVLEVLGAVGRPVAGRRHYW